MNVPLWLKNNYLSMPLIALMALTRVHHFGDAFSLPDASLAVFFLAGLRFNKLGLLVFLLLEAAVLDYVAIAHFSVSDYCISAAYVFLIPTYAVMWFAGRHCSKHPSLAPTELAISMGWATLATTAAFVISNGSFYLFSGRFAAVSLADYATRTMQYYPAYTSAALLYTLVGLAVIKIMLAMPAYLNKHNTI
ncbi:MAG: hypothetical protein ABL925_11415 [Methylococcales bacterium]